MSMPTDIQVLIVDDHEWLRVGLAQFLEANDGITVVGTAANGVEAVELCSRLHPHVVLMDIMMPKLDGIAATKIIRQQYPQIAVVILTISTGYRRKPEALAAGASNYLVKGVSGKQIADALRAAAQ
jgi:two-component system, NarL family, response regulator LiaR